MADTPDRVSGLPKKSKVRERTRRGGSHHTKDRHPGAGTPNIQESPHNPLAAASASTVGTSGEGLGQQRKSKQGMGTQDIKGSAQLDFELGSADPAHSEGIVSSDSISTSALSPAGSASILGIPGGGSGQPRKPKATGTLDIEEGSVQLDFELGSADPAHSEGIVSSDSISTSTLSPAGSVSVLGTPGGGSGQPRKPKGTGTLDVKAGSAHLDHELGSADSARFEGVVSSDSISTSTHSAAGNASILGILGGGSRQPRKPKSGTGIPDIYEPGLVDLAPNVGQETQGKQTDHSAPVTPVGHRSHQPRKKVAITRPIITQGPDVVFYEEQLEKLRSELSRASARADELQQRHDTQSKVLDSAHSQLKIKTEQITNARRDHEKLQGDLSASSAQILDLQKRYDAQSQDVHSTRQDLQAKVSLLEEKEHDIISLSDKVAQAEHKHRTMVDQVATAQGAVDQLRVELSSASSRTTEVQKRYEAQSQEFDAARDELRKLKGLYQDDSSNQGVADHIRSALEEKNQQIEVLREDLAASTTRNDELQKSCEALSRDVSDLRDELKVKTSDCESTIISLNSQVERWKSLDGANKEQIATSLKRVKELQDDLSSSTSRLAQLQGRYDVQSRDLTTVREELHSSILSCENKEGTIVSLTTEVGQWKDASADKTKRLTAALEQVEELHRDPTSIPGYIELYTLYEEQTVELDAAQQHLSISTSEIKKFQDLYEEHSNELAVVRKELNTSISSGKSKDVTITTLDVEVQKWKDAGANKSKQVATILEKTKKLEDDLSASASKFNELQHLHEEQSREFAGVRNELKTSVSSGKDKDFTISTLATEIEEWRGAGVDEPKKVTTILELVKKLRGDLSTSTSKLDTLQSVHEKQLDELASVRGDLQASISSGRDKDLTIAGLTDEVQRWKDAGADESEQIATLLEQVKKLQDDLATSTSKLDELQKLYKNQSDALTVVHDELQVSTSSGKEKDVTIATLTAEVGEWKKSAGVDEPKKVAVILEQVEKLRLEHSTSESQLVQLRFVYEEQSITLTNIEKELQASILYGKDKDAAITTLTDEVQQWKDAGADESKQVAALVEQVKRLQDDLATSTSKLDELQKLYQDQSDALTVVRDELQVNISSGKERDVTIASLTAEIGEWKSAGVDEPKKVAVILGQVEKLRQEHSTSESRLAQLRSVYEEQLTTLTVVQKELQASILYGKDKDATITTLTDEVRQWKDAGTDESKQVAVLVEQVKKLQDDLATSTSKLDELQKLYQDQSDALTVVRDELQVNISSGNVKDVTIATLTAEVGEWKSAGVDEPKNVAVILGQVENLRQEHSTSTSQLAQLRTVYEEQSSTLTIVQKELQASILYGKDKDTTITALIDEVQQWKDTSASESSEVATILNQVAKLQQSLSTSVSELEEFHNLYEEQSTKLTAVQKELKDSISTGKEQGLTIAALTDDVQKWKDAGSNESKQVATILEEVDRLQSDLSTSASELAQFKALYEQHLHDLTIVREELQARILSEEGKDRELVVTRKDLEQLRDDLATATSQIERLKESEVAAADELTAADEDLEKLRRDLSASSSQIIEIQQRYEAQSSQLERWKNSDATKELQLSAADKKLELRRQELSTLSSQLDKVHRFFTIADTHPDTAIIQMVQKLNAEVQQNTTVIAECILDEFQPQGEASSEEQNPAIQRVSVYIGQALAGSLRRKKRDDLALYLQIAFQAFLTHYLSGVISAWTTKEEHNSVIDTIYQELQTHEAQTISGHWRSLTRAYISPTCRSHPHTIISTAVAGLSDILVAAGCAISASAAKSSVSTKFPGKVSSIIQIAGELSKMIGEVVSSDFEVLAIQPDVAFEETKMEEDVDDYDDRDMAGGTTTGKKVLCSTHLGLTKRMPQESGKITLTAMKAKVLLESFLNA